MDFIEGCEIVDYEKAYDRALKAISDLAQDAKMAGVSIGIENVWNKFLLSPLELRSFIDAVGSNYVGSYLDVGNIVHSGYPEQWIRIHKYRVRRCISKITAGQPEDFMDLLIYLLGMWIILLLWKHCKRSATAIMLLEK